MYIKIFDDLEIQNKILGILFVMEFFSPINLFNLYSPTPFWKNFGLFFHAINIKYTGMDDKIIKQPYPKRNQIYFKLNVSIE